MTVLEHLTPIARFVATLDLSDVRAAKAALDDRFPDLSGAEAALRTSFADGALTPRRASPEVTFGRVCKSTPDTDGVSIDAVEMAGPGAAHTHPNGEVSLCLANGGDDPRFMGEPPGFVVAPPGSHHTPTVTGGRMLIVYFLPGGAMVFDA